MYIYISCWYFRHNDTINLYRYSWKSFGSWSIWLVDLKVTASMLWKIPGFWLLDGHAFQCLESRGGVFAAMGVFPYFSCFLLWMKVGFWLYWGLFRNHQKKSQEPSFAWKSWATCNNSTWKASILDVGRKNGPCCKRHQKKNKCCHVLPNKKSKVKTWGRQQVTSSWVYASSVINSDYWMILTQVKRTYPETSSEGYTRKLVVGRIWAN